MIINTEKLRAAIVDADECDILKNCSLSRMNALAYGRVRLFSAIELIEKIYKDMGGDAVLSLIEDAYRG